MGQGPHFVVEACEYDRSFLNLSPYASIINNIDADHLDYYRDLDDVESAFAALAARVRPGGWLFVNGDDERAHRVGHNASCTCETFGESERCDWRYENVKRLGGWTRFDIRRHGASLGEFRLKPPGVHNVSNACAAVAVTTTLGATPDTARRALEDFRGADRRLQLVGDVNGVRVLDDYAHHPTEIETTLAAVRSDYPDRRLWCVFQPHQCSRTRLLFQQFAAAFGLANQVVIAEIYSVRDSEQDRRAVSAEDLARGVRDHNVRAQHITRFPDVVDHLQAHVTPGDVVVTMGAGPVDAVARGLVERLEHEKHVAAA
jgi:UDP-N-acetylmuramate--alanine ligase